MNIKNVDNPKVAAKHIEVLSVFGEYPASYSEKELVDKLKLKEEELKKILSYYKNTGRLAKDKQGSFFPKRNLTDYIQNLKKVCSKKRTKTSEIIEMVQNKTARLFLDQYKNFFAQVRVDGHFETWPLKSLKFKTWVLGNYYNLTGNTLTDTRLSVVTKILYWKAYSKGEQIKLKNRVAKKDDALFYDLTNKRWEIVKITKGSWGIQKQDYPIFRRFSHQNPQTVSKNQRDLELIENFWNIKKRDNLLLAKVILVTFFVPDIPHAILVPYGSQGSAKSTIFKTIKKLVDPSCLSALTFPRSKKELVQQLYHHYFCPFDNISYLPSWISDTLCRSISGEGFSKRALYTDDEDIIYQYKRCVGLNGINAPPKKPDLLDRSVLLGLERISRKERTEEKTFWQQFEKDRSKILAGIFETISSAMKIVETVELKEKPRMADFARWGEAISQSLGYAENEFLRAYFNNIDSQNTSAIENHILGEVVLELMEEKNKWKGTATQLLEKLENIAQRLKVNTKTKKWPSAPNVVTRRLNEIKSNLKEMGIEISRKRVGSKGRRQLIIEKKPSEPSVKSKNTLKAQKEAKEATDDVSCHKDFHNKKRKQCQSKNRAKGAQDSKSDDTDDTDDKFHTNLSEVEKQICDFIEKSKGAQTQDIITVVDNKTGAKPETIEKLMTRLKRDGTIFSPRAGEWKIT